MREHNIAYVMVRGEPWHLTDKTVRPAHTEYWFKNEGLGLSIAFRVQAKQLEDMKTKELRRIFSDNIEELLERRK